MEMDCLTGKLNTEPVLSMKQLISLGTMTVTDTVSDGDSMFKDAFILELKWKWRHFQSVALLSICVFIRQRQQEQQRSKKKITFALV